MKLRLLSPLLLCTMSAVHVMATPPGIVVPELLPQQRIAAHTPQRFLAEAVLNQPAVPPSLFAGRHIVDPIALELDATEIATLKRNDLIELDTPDRFCAIEIDAIQKTTPGTSILEGRLVSCPNSQVIITRVGDALAGLIVDRDTEQEYELRRGADGNHWIYAVDPSGRAACGGSPTPDPTIDAMHLAGLEAAGLEWNESFEALSADAGRVPLAACNPPSQPVVDYAVFYTSLARQAAGGTSAIEALCLLYVQWANQAYINSDIDLRMRMVYCGETTYDEQPGPDYDPDSVFSEHLGRFSARVEYSSIKNLYRADAAMLLMADNASGGLAWCCANNPGRTNGVMFWNNGAGTFAHEFGHNQGCAHDPNNVDCICASYGRAHVFTGNDQVVYGTIMSYLGQEIQNFSNPNIFFMGVATGVANQFDNARVIRSTRSTMQNIYPTRADIWLDFTALFGAHDGTFTQPYHLLADAVTNVIEPLCPSELPTLWIKAGTTSQTMTISKPMQIKACGGTVRIGD